MFEFYYQSGEFLADSSGWGDFFKDLIVQIAGTGLGALSALWLYRKQTKAQRDKEEEDRNQLEINKLLFFKTLADGAIKSSLIFETSVFYCVEALKLDHSKVENLTISSTEDLRRLVFELPREEIFLAYRKRLRNNGLQNAFNSIDHMQSTITGTMAIWTNAVAETTKLKEVISDLTNKILNEINLAEVNNSEDQMLKEDLTGIIKEYFEIPKQDITRNRQNQEKFCDEILDLLANNFFPNQTRWNILIQTCYDCKRRLAELKNCGKWLQIHFQDSYTTLKEINEYFEVNYLELDLYLAENTGSVPYNRKDLAWYKAIPKIP